MGLLVFSAGLLFLIILLLFLFVSLCISADWQCESVSMMGWVYGGPWGPHTLPPKGKRSLPWLAHGEGLSRWWGGQVEPALENVCGHARLVGRQGLLGGQ